eukprot:17349-Pelagococcus_subviridis.AAC.1
MAGIESGGLGGETPSKASSGGVVRRRDVSGLKPCVEWAERDARGESPRGTACAAPTRSRGESGQGKHQISGVIRQLAQHLHERGHAVRDRRGQRRGQLLDALRVRDAAAERLRALRQLRERVARRRRDEVRDREDGRIDAQHAHAVAPKIDGQEALRERPQVRGLILRRLRRRVQPARVQDVRRELRQRARRLLRLARCVRRRAVPRARDRDGVLRG